MQPVVGLFCFADAQVRTDWAEILCTGVFLRVLLGRAREGSLWDVVCRSAARKARVSWDRCRLAG